MVVMAVGGECYCCHTQVSYDQAVVLDIWYDHLETFEFYDMQTGMHQVGTYWVQRCHTHTFCWACYQNRVTVRPRLTHDHGISEADAGAGH